MRTEMHSYTSNVSIDRVFHTDAQPQPVSGYFNSSSLWQYLWSYMYIMSILCSAADAVSSGSWFIVFTDPTLKVAMLMFLHLSWDWVL